MARPDDNKIRELLAVVDGDCYAVAETLCDSEVARGEYAGCSTDLELAFSEYERRAQQLKSSCAVCEGHGPVAATLPIVGGGRWVVCDECLATAQELGLTHPADMVLKLSELGYDIHPREEARDD